MKTVGIVMPVANEELTIVGFLDGLLAELSKLPYKFTVYLIMDDFSKDSTLNLVKEFAQKDSRIQLVYFAESTGVVSCRLKGFKDALTDGCDYIIEMDSGGSHPPAKIQDILKALDREGFDAVFMSRFLKSGGTKNFPFYRLLISRGGSILSNLWLGTNYSDATSGMEAFRRHVLAAMDLDAFISVGGIYQTEMKYYCYLQNLKIKELPFIYISTTTAFKMKWVLIALKTLFKLKLNKNRVLKQDLIA